jgi:glycerol uptake facilitator-like aquaporin
VFCSACNTATGGHLNPAVTTAMLVARRISLLRWFVYVVAQMAG